MHPTKQELQSRQEIHLLSHRADAASRYPLATTAYRSAARSCVVGDDCGSSSSALHSRYLRPCCGGLVSALWTQMGFPAVPLSVQVTSMIKSTRSTKVRTYVRTPPARAVRVEEGMVPRLHATLKKARKTTKQPSTSTLDRLLAARAFQLVIFDTGYLRT